MKIQSSEITMSSTRSYLERYERTESLKFWSGDTRPDFEGTGPGDLPPAAPPAGEVKSYIVELSPEAKEAAKANKAGELAKAEDEDLKLAPKDRLMIRLIEKFVEVLTGKKLKIKVKDLQSLNAEYEKVRADLSQLSARVGVTNAPQGWGLEYDYHELQYEREETSFSASGIIRTADGQEIDFSVSLNMTREFMREQNISIRAGDAVKKDPLVINFDGTAAQLTTTKFSFDIDSDGSADQISFVSGNSGFLALDVNNDGTVNNGSELFGPATGNGLAELSEYDADNNNWIDENDSIFNKLRIWTRDEQGANRLLALGQAGIGAIFLGSVETPFAVKDSQNQLQGQVVKSGVTVNEDGTVGTIQQIDLAV